MIVRLLLALIALVGVMAFLGWYGRATPSQRNDAIKSLLLYGVGIALLVLVVTGRIPWLFAIISAIIPFWRKISVLGRYLGLFSALTGKSFGATSLTTEWLVIDFNFSTRALDAQIRKGDFSGQRLSQLNKDQLSQLLQACRDDLQSSTAVRAFMAARFRQTGSAGDDRQQKTSAGDVNMSKAQAYEVLGLQPDAEDADIRKAHKRLIQKLHPDRGGSEYLATQINLAKDTLLNDHAR